tara:strand:- start:280 stop:459 length:180 start_codon:yes stop_codon:yes gene_type:complete
VIVLVKAVDFSFGEALAFLEIVLDLPETEEAAEVFLVVALVVALVLGIWKKRLVSCDFN